MVYIRGNRADYTGIGPAADLELAHVPCVHELPVGQGLQDHLATWITYTRPTSRRC